MTLESIITCVVKDKDGNITHVGCKNLPWTVRKSEVIENIERLDYLYYISEDGTRSDVEVFEKDGVKHIRTKRDSTVANNLDNLNICPLDLLII